MTGTGISHHTTGLSPINRNVTSVMVPHLQQIDLTVSFGFAGALSLWYGMKIRATLNPFL